VYFKTKSKEVFKLQGGVRKRGSTWSYYFDVMLESGFIETEKQKVEVYLKDWLECHIKDNRKINTYNRYAGIIKNNINPRIGKILLKNIKPIQIDKMINSKKKEKTLSGATL
jgi:hypothetical protein